MVPTVKEFARVMLVTAATTLQETVHLAHQDCMDRGAATTASVIKMEQSCVLIKMEDVSVEEIGLVEHVSCNVHLVTSTPLAILNLSTTALVSVQTISTDAAWSLGVSVRLVKIVGLKILIGMWNLLHILLRMSM